MLSKNAFNALLKTLEEPPAHVKFIFATTEIRKVPVTILSRCQRFDLQRLTIEDLNGLFHKIMAAEKLDFEEEALHLIAKAADGSARDGESLLDQAISLGGGVVKTDIVKEMIGLADRNQTFGLFENLIKGDVAKVMENIQDQYKNGANPTAMLQDLINITHMSAKAKIIVDFCEDVSLAEMEHDFCRRVKDNVSIAVLSKIWQMMLKGISELAIAPVQIDALEMILIRIAYSASLPTPSELLNDVKKNSNLSQAATIQAPQFLKSQENSTSVVSPANEKAVFNQIEDLLKYLTDTKQMLLMYALKNDVAIEEFSSGQIKMTVSTKMADDFMLNLQKVLTEATGLKWKLDISKGQLGATIFDQEQAENTANKKSISEYPLVRAILEEFKGATFETMTRKINLDIVEEESEFRTPDSETYFDDDLTREE